jgi:oxygen-dependent protoporphyrinogen oxidase
VPHLVIIGAGISGLAAAFHLQERLPAAEITVLEAGQRVGGTIWTERRDGFQVELGPNGFLDNKTSTIDLCQQLGLREHLIAASDTARHRFLYLNGKLQPLPEGGWSFVRSPLLSWMAKLAVLTERFCKRRLDGKEESVHDFFSRRISAEAADVFGDALVTGIHAGDPHLLSMAAAFPRITAMEREYGSILVGMKHLARQRRAEAKARGEEYRSGAHTLSFREGLRLLVETLRDRLRKPPILGVAVKRLERTTEGQPRWLVHGEVRDSWSADAVILACPAYQQAAMLADLDAELAELLAGIAYSPAVVVALGYRRQEVPHPLDGFGYIVPQKTRSDILGSQWCSTIFPDRAPSGCVLLRAIAGGWHRQDMVDWDDDRLIRAVRQHYRQALSIEAAPVFQHLTRWRKAIPQYHLGHLERLSRIEQHVAQIAGLFVSGNAYHGVALNDCTEQASRVAERAAEFLSAV